MRKLSSVLITLFLFAICITSTAQTVDTAIGGTVTDSTGAIIPNATVTIDSSSTGISKRAVTNSAGEYSVRIWHPSMDRAEETTGQQVTLTADAPANAEWQIGLKPNIRVPRVSGAASPAYP